MKKFLCVIALIGIFYYQNVYSQWWEFQFVNTGASPHYDFASYSSANFIAEAYGFNRSIAFMQAPPGQPNNLNIGYYFSDNSGLLYWVYVGTVNSSKNGFPFVRSFDDGIAYISTTKAIPSNGAFNKMSVCFDAAPGLGAFTEVYPANRNLIYCKSIYTNANPFYCAMVAQSPTSDSIYYCSNTVTEWQYIGRTPKEAYSIAKGNTKIGIAFIANSDIHADNKCVYLIESTNGGVNYSSPLKLYQSDAANNGFAAHRGISMVYMDDEPCITFDAAIYNSASDSYDIKAPAKIMLWQSSLPGIDPDKSIIMADSTNVPMPPRDSIKTGTDDEYPLLSRPVIGITKPHNMIMVVFQVITQNWGGVPPDTANYKALYARLKSGIYLNNSPKRLTPATPLLDWSYPSISPTNADEYLTYKYNICAICDTIPGTRVITGSNTNCNPGIFFINANVILSDIKKLGDLTPSNFTLQQNYPNPFNPATKIKFAVPNVRNKNVSIKIYDALGKELETLVDKVMSSGWYEVNFDGSRYPSGVYFYRLQCGNYSETKKMVLVK